MDNEQLAKSLQQILGLRWSPVALRLMRPGEGIPEGLMEPPMPLRHCQSIIVARRGNCLYLPPRKHACPDGAGVLGLVEMSPKLRSGELYLLFKKLPNLECARTMIAGRPEFAPGTYAATVLAPLEKATFVPDVVIFTLWPEQAMWLCCAQTYTSGKRQVFNTSGYNSTCADLTVKVMQTGEMNISFGCYGARASSEIDDFELYISIPYGQLQLLVKALQQLSLKSIPEERKKIYMHPVMDNIRKPSEKVNGRVELQVNQEQCNGCGLCEAFCPVAVFEMFEAKGARKARPVLVDKCSACYTCVGQCPQKAIQLRIRI
ncbi:MAG: 4Fe-4S binding protein [Firmicutes bacterium]|nr:4Fe-4S binding protein [Bacillota bacterium]